MKSLQLFALVGACVLGPSHLCAQEEDEQAAGAQLLCNYNDYGSFKIQYATVLASDSVAQPLSAVTSVRLGKGAEYADLRIEPGHLAECIYPNGESVRVKVGSDVARGYGYCGGNPSIFLSLWVNRRKIDSRVWFAGHCKKTGVLAYRISVSDVEKCQSAKNSESAKPDSATLEVCVPFPETNRFPFDEIEYPSGTELPVGSIELRSGQEAVCLAVKDELGSNWYAFFGSGRPLSFDALNFGESNVEIDARLRGSTQSDFDFDNDGAPNRVVSTAYQSNYMHGSSILVDPLMDAASNLSDGWFLPCQLDTKRIPLRSCPPFTQANDEAGFAIANPGQDDVFFRARYTHLRPFGFHGATYLAVASESADTSEFVAVLKPQRGKSFERTCLLRRIPENF